MHGYALTCMVMHCHSFRPIFIFFYIILSCMTTRVHTWSCMAMHFTWLLLFSKLFFHAWPRIDVHGHAFHLTLIFSWNFSSCKTTHGHAFSYILMHDEWYMTMYGLTWSWMVMYCHTLSCTNHFFTGNYNLKIIIRILNYWRKYFTIYILYTNYISY